MAIGEAGGSVVSRRLLWGGSEAKGTRFCRRVIHMADESCRTACAVERGVCCCRVGGWEWRFDAERPEEGFALIPEEGSERGPLPPAPAWAKLFRIRHVDPVGSPWNVEDVFTIGATRCVVRYRDVSQGRLELSLVATVSYGLLEEKGSGSAGAHELAVVLLARTERPMVEPGIRIVNEIHARCQTALGTIEISHDELKASTFPIVLAHGGTGSARDTVRFSFEAFQLFSGQWLAACIHPLDGVEEPRKIAPSRKDESGTEEVGDDLQTQLRRYAFEYRVFPEGIEKGVTFAARGLAIMFPEQTSRTVLLRRLREFLISERPISES